MLITSSSTVNTVYSCETALAYLINKILWLAIDLSAAFDTVEHPSLLEIIHHKYGVRGSALTWIDNYLRPRWCCVQLENTSSDYKNISFSDPQ